VSRSHVFVSRGHFVVPQSHVFVSRSHVLTPQSRFDLPQSHVFVSRSHVLTLQSRFVVPQSRFVVPQCHVLIPQNRILSIHWHFPLWKNQSHPYYKRIKQVSMILYLYIYNVCRKNFLCRRIYREILTATPKIC
jgi:hypothetical protein